MEQKSQLFEEGYGKGWLYKDSEFIDFVFYHYQIFQVLSTTRIRSGSKKTPPKYKLSGNFKFANFSGNIGNGWFLLLVTKTKGFKIYLEQKDELLKTYYFVQVKGGEVEQK
jgi:hypothetical protein